MDKNKAMIDFIKLCPQIASNKLFFNFIQAKDNNKLFATISEDVLTEKSYVDGSVEKQYTFTILDYRSIVYQPLVSGQGYNNENVDEMFDIQGIIDWVDTKDKAREYPNFGNDCLVEKVYALNTSPNLDGVDSTMSPPLAKYSISIRVLYLDKSEMIWK